MWTILKLLGGIQRNYWGGYILPSSPGFGTPAYNDNYLNLGFTSVKANGEVRQQCVLCLEVLARSSLKEAKLRRCLETKLVKYVDENHSFFKSKKL